MNNDDTQAQPQQPDAALLDLDDDTPMACPMRQPGDDGDVCEACQ